VVYGFLSAYVSESLFEYSTLFVEGIMVGLELRGDYSAGDFRALARKSRDAKQARRLMALAGVADDLSRTQADRQAKRIHSGMDFCAFSGFENKPLPGNSQAALGATDRVSVSPLSPGSRCLQR
jgi:hypothetical protein